MPRALQYEVYAGAAPAEPFPEGEEVLQVRIPPGKEVTSNRGCASVWRHTQNVVQKISAKASASQPEITRDLVEDIFKAVDRVFAEMSLRVKTRTDRLFDDTYGGPPHHEFIRLPIIWTGRNMVALDAILKFVSAAYQIPNVPSNSLDNGIVIVDAVNITKPLYTLKADLMRQWLGLEVRGEVSPDELDAIYRDSDVRPPLFTSVDDKHDTTADTAAEDERALSDESAHVPTQETLESVKAGKEVWTFVPTEAHWMTFGRIADKYNLEGPEFDPGQPFPFGDTVGANSGGGSSGGTSGGGNLTQPG